MSETELVAHAQAALAANGIEDRVDAAGQFYPRGHTGAGFAGGMLGGDLGGAAGAMGDAAGTVAGYAAGVAAHDAASGLPDNMLVAVSAGSVYGFAIAHRDSPPGQLVFRVSRDGLEAKVHGRVNVRVLELIHTDDGSSIELEGSRIPLTHSKDVIEELTR